MSDVGWIPREQKTMTKHSYLKQEIRARMAITGESYSAAARAIAKDEPLPSEAKITSSAPQETAELRALVIFTERLAVLLSGAMTMRAAFEVSEQTTEDPVLKRGIREVLEANEANTPMEEAIAARPWAFPGIFSAVVNNGLKNGSFYDSMKQMAQLYRTEMELERPKSEPIHLSLGPATRDTKPPFDWRSTDRRPIAVFIGKRSQGVELARMSPAWRFAYFPSVESFRAWNRDSSQEVEAVLISDGIYSSGMSGEVFEKFIAEESSSFFIGIISVKPRNRKAIASAVEDLWREAGVSSQELYFIGEDWMDTFSADKVADRFRMATAAQISSLLSLRIRSTLNEPSISKDWHPSFEEPEAKGYPSESPLVEWGTGSPDAEIRLEARKLDAAHSDPFSWSDDDSRPLAVYIGPRAVGEALAKIQKQWKFLRYESPKSFMEAMDQAKVDSAAVSSILVVDKYFDPQGRDEEFEMFAANMAPYCFFGIVSYSKSLQGRIRAAVDEAAADADLPSGEIYFIDSQTPSASLDREVSSFIVGNSDSQNDQLQEVARRLNLA